MDIRVTLSAREARTFFFGLLAIELLLLAAYLTLHVLGAGLEAGPLRPWLDLGADTSVPAWFSSIQLFLVGAVLLVAALNNGRPDVVRPSFLAAAGLAFVFLSADESARIHEKITEVARAGQLNWLLIHGTHGAWIMVYLVAGALLLAAGRRSLLALWRHLRHEMQVAAAGALVFVAGGVGVELIGFYLVPGSTPYKVATAVEEFLEMAGVSVMLYAALLVNRALAPGRSLIPDP